MCNNKKIQENGTQEKEVSVVVTLYNGRLKAILATLKSIIIQKGISFNVILSDDGSKKFYENEIRNFFELSNFSDYIIIRHEKNKGTVANVQSALKYVNSKYVKIIGQGDLLYDKDTLKKFVDFMKENHFHVAFGKLAGFDPKTLEINEFFSPKDIYCYLRNDYKKIKEEFIFYLNGPCGAAHLYETEYLIKYISKIAGKVKFCEDNILAMMFLDEVQIGYFRDFVVWYEVGFGISSSNNSNTSKIMRTDQFAFFQLLYKDYKQKLTKKALNIYTSNLIENSLKRKLMKVISNPNVLLFKLQLIIHKKMNADELNISNADTKLLNEIYQVY